MFALSLAMDYFSSLIYSVLFRSHRIPQSIESKPSAQVVRPSFDDLPLNAGDPKGSAWGLWGPQDERGTLNLITDDVVRRAQQEIVTGAVVQLK